MRPIVCSRPANSLRSGHIITLALWIAAHAMAAPSSVLGVDFSEWFPAANQMAPDSSGALYLLQDCPASSAAGSCVTKVSADGANILWQDALGFQAITMAVSAAGDVFVIPAIHSSDTSLHVAKLASGGSGIAWTASTGFLPPASLTVVLAADSQGRTYVSAPSADTSVYETSSLLVRLNSNGTAVDWTTAVTGWPTSIAADGTGAVVVTGYIPGIGAPTVFVTRVASNGTAGYYAQLPGQTSPVLALDADGNAVILSTGSRFGLLQRFNAFGGVVASTQVVGALGNPQLALDSAGNAYVLGKIGQLYPVSHSVATCLAGSSYTPQTGVGSGSFVPMLIVVTPTGEIAQNTYLPGAIVDLNNDRARIAVGPGSTVFVTATAAAGFVPTASGAFPPANDATFLTRLSFHSAAQTLSMACVGNAATYFTLPVAPGELVTLTGNGLGPSQGVQPPLTPQTPLPTQVSGVQITFDGTPAPLLWVQDSQINAFVPWSVTPGGNTKICLFLNGAVVNCLTWPVALTAPGVFSTDGTHAAAINQDGTLNSAKNPASPGSIVAVWATGLGPVSPPQADGTELGSPLPANVLPAGLEAWWLNLSPPFNSLIERPIPVAYSGPAPNLVAGISQINFQVPPANSAVPDNSTYYLTLPSASSAVSSTRSQNFLIYVAGSEP